ncbi:LysR family transcriptional regulator [Vibrio sp. SM6]|uniref:LysR family transcriptional regulator n=1 Tax=Vibrio agarilyticus TaxID=2726741 RepID=A0A7X8TS29_9VIBR|nr:LysR family transcriptional regulator [Vibrio agarilyticus]NLS13776.1 LysR family transcriptional regulator [Vibrio agarilyticus]
MNLDHLTLFVRLANTLNISAAGAELGLSPALASGHLNKLEQELGVRLVHRTTRKVSLTEEGKAFLPHAEELLNRVEQAKASVGMGAISPSGTLRITAPASFGCMHLMPAMKGFLAAYPDLSVDLHFSDSIIDMVEGGFDLAIRNASLQDSTLVARKLASDTRILCAAPDYIAQYGLPTHPKDLIHYQCINLGKIDSWTFRTPDGNVSIKPHGRVKTDNGEALRDASVAGLGIGLNSLWSVYQHLEQGTLIPVLSDFPLENTTAIWALYPSSRLVAPKVRAFIDYMIEYIGTPPYWE